MLLAGAPEDRQNNCPKHVELTGIINKPLLLNLVGCLYYLYQWCTVTQISDNGIYLLIKYIKSVLWRVAKRLSYTEDARCLKVKHWICSPFVLQISLLSYETQWQNALLTENSRNLCTITCCCTHTQLFYWYYVTFPAIRTFYFLLITIRKVLEIFCNVQWLQVFHSLE